MITEIKVSEVSYFFNFTRNLYKSNHHSFVTVIEKYIIYAYPRLSPNLYYCSILKTTTAADIHLGLIILSKSNSKVDLEVEIFLVFLNTKMGRLFVLLCALVFNLLFLLFRAKSQIPQSIIGMGRVIYQM